MVCDFFCQPEVPVPHELFAPFAAAVAADLDDPRREVRRIELLLPLYRIKWCLILLNDFLPVAGSRRRFAGAAGEQEHLASQLARARRIVGGL
jgi:hypothetical protein